MDPSHWETCRFSPQNDRKPELFRSTSQPAADGREKTHCSDLQKPLKSAPNTNRCILGGGGLPRRAPQTALSAFFLQNVGFGMVLTSLLVEGKLENPRTRFDTPWGFGVCRGFGGVLAGLWDSPFRFGVKSPKFGLFSSSRLLKLKKKKRLNVITLHGCCSVLSPRHGLSGEHQLC